MYMTRRALWCTTEFICTLYHIRPTLNYHRGWFARCAVVADLERKANFHILLNIDCEFVINGHMARKVAKY